MPVNYCFLVECEVDFENRQVLVTRRGQNPSTFNNEDIGLGDTVAVHAGESFCLLDNHYDVLVFFDAEEPEVYDEEREERRYMEDYDSDSQSFVDFDVAAERDLENDEDIQKLLIEFSSYSTPSSFPFID